MRKTSLFVFLALAVACVHNPGENEEMSRTFTATSEYGTRTTLDGTEVLWSAEDRISIFSKTTPLGEAYSIRTEDAGKKSAAFSGPEVGAGPWFALYPADAAASMSDGSLTFMIPCEQRYSANSFGSGNNPMVAVSSTESLNFKNLCGLLKLNLTGSGTVKSIVLKTNAEEALWGSATVSLDYTDAPALQLTQTADEEHRALKLDCGAGVTLGNEPAGFYFVVPAGTLGSGFSVDISDADGNTVSRTTSTSINISRAVIKGMKPIDCQLSGSPFLLEGGYGVYDLGGSAPVPVRVFGQGDQLALRNGQVRTFRIQSLVNANALSISFPQSMTVGESCSISVVSTGSTGVAGGTIEAVLLQQADGKCWLEDKASKTGYIIASEL